MVEVGPTQKLLVTMLAMCGNVKETGIHLLLASGFIKNMATENPSLIIDDCDIKNLLFIGKFPLLCLMKTKCAGSAAADIGKLRVADKGLI